MALNESISIEDFSKVDLRVGKIIDVQIHEGSRKPMYKIKVDIGEFGTSDIVAGIRDRYTREELLDKSVVVVANLNPKEIAGALSSGMLLVAEDSDGTIAIVSPEKSIKPGSKIR